MLESPETYSDYEHVQRIFDAQTKKLKEKVKKERMVEAFNIIRRSFVPTALQDDSITFKSNIVIGNMGVGKSTLISAFANAIEDFWLQGSDIFFEDPLVIFANSLPAVFSAVEEKYSGQDYLMIVVDDAIRHASSRMGMSRAGRQSIWDYAGVRHILQDQCGVSAPSFASFTWVTQWFRELMPSMRKGNLFFYKAINVGEGDLKEFQRTITPEGAEWLSGITEQIYLWNNYDFMDYFLLMTAWDPMPYYLRLDRKGQKVRKYKIYEDRTHDEQLEEIVEFLDDYREKRPDLLPLVNSKRGYSIISDLITDQFPDSIVTMSKVHNAYTRRLFETGLFTDQKKISGGRAVKWKRRYMDALIELKKLSEGKTYFPGAFNEFLETVGFNDIRAFRVFMSQNKELLESK